MSGNDGHDKDGSDETATRREAARILAGHAGAAMPLALVMLTSSKAMARSRHGRPGRPPRRHGPRPGRGRPR